MANSRFPHLDRLFGVDTLDRTNFPALRTRRATALLSALSLIEGGFLLLSNFLAAKVWLCGPFILDGGILVFPILYVVGDLLVELFRQPAADRVALRACVLNFVAIVACFVVVRLPELPDANPIELASAFGLSARVMSASIAAFCLSSLLNNSLFEVIRRHTKRSQFVTRALGSSLGAHVIDTASFTTIAFAGRYPFGTLLQQMVWSFLAAVIVEVMLSPLARICAFKLHDYLADPTISAKPATPVEPAAKTKSTASVTPP